MVCLELDANAKVGLTVIQNDPHEMSINGEYLMEFTERNNLVICNATDKCDGTITREMATINGVERSVLDYFIICQELYLLLSSMNIDESRKLVLSRYSKKNDQVKVTKSDHNVLVCNFNLKWSHKRVVKQK